MGDTFLSKRWLSFLPRQAAKNSVTRFVFVQDVMRTQKRLTDSEMVPPNLLQDRQGVGLGRQFCGKARVKPKMQVVKKGGEKKGRLFLLKKAVANDQT